MLAPKKRCYVVMGFGKKTDFATGRTLDLDKSYRNMIKPAVEAAGLSCVRADEIVHSGLIDVAMYQQLLEADVVVADLSTANKNAFYELGVRHALRPFTTVVICEDGVKNPPFDVNHIPIRSYHHLGDEIAFDEVMRFRAELTKAIGDIWEKAPEERRDSPVYRFLDKLKPPVLSGVTLGADEARPAPDTSNAATQRALMEQVDKAKKESNFVKAKALLSSIREMAREREQDKPEDPYIIQQLALVTYKSKQPTPQTALREARALLLALNPVTSNDTETLGLWGTVHKRLWDETHERTHLDEAVRGYERGFYLRNDHYNGINLAYMLNVRAANAVSHADAVADFIEAQRVRREVLAICEEELADGSLSDESRYWVIATMAEAYLGIGDEVQAEKRFKEAASMGSESWMMESLRGQMTKLRSLLADSPLKYVITA
ncbi:MAG TPA: TRAFs-binding domain-containing protein [Pyrinomonadaceae bacterium]|nr:TRAFs-binding domain-containing protein [Pyrinomonadaceae bacterium]